MNWSRTRTGMVGVAVLLGVLVFVIPNLLRQVTNSFLFHPVRGQDRTPKDVGLAYLDLRLEADDGVATEAWWIPYSGPAGSGLGVSVVTFHGNAGTMADRLEHTRLLHDRGVSVLCAEYRGYGDSEGSPDEEGLAADARAALDRLGEFAAPRGDRIVVHGRSLGGAVAIRLASDEPVDGLLVESTFTSLQEMASRSGIPFASHLVAYRFDSLDRVGSVVAPVLIVHGEADELIPFSMGEQLRDRVASAGGKVDLLGVPGGTHNDTWVRAGDVYWLRVSSWLRSIGTSSP